MAGEVKTRLVGFLSPENAASLYACLLVDLLANLRSFDAADRYLAYAPAGSEISLRKMVPEEFRFLAQTGRDLGERMRGVFQDLLDAGYRSVVLIGSDLPVFPTEVLDHAFALLDGVNADLVLGPNRDGGYYLIGMQHLVAEVFDGMDWGADTVFEATRDRIKALRLRVSLLPPWFDVDTPADVAGLWAHVDQLDPKLQRRTIQWLNDWRAGKIPVPRWPGARNS